MLNFKEYKDKKDESIQDMVYSIIFDLNLAFLRIRAAVPSGTLPSLSHASVAASSTSSQTWNLWSSVQMDAISGRE